MSPSIDKTIFFEAGTVLFLTVGIFLLDVLTPLGWAAWLLYFIPLVVTVRSPREHDPYNYSAVVTLLIAVGGYLPTGETDSLAALVNRVLGVMVMWAFTWLMVRQKQAHALLAGVEAARLQAETAVGPDGQSVLVYYHLTVMVTFN